MCNVSDLKDWFEFGHLKLRGSRQRPHSDPERDGGDESEFELGSVNPVVLR